MQLKPSSLVACSVICRRLIVVLFVISIESFSLLVQDVVCLKSGGDPEQIVCLVWSHWQSSSIKVPVLQVGKCCGLLQYLGRQL